VLGTPLSADLGRDPIAGLEQHDLSPELGEQLGELDSGEIGADDGDAPSERECQPGEAADPRGSEPGL
jgi:hypothetical protein